jgi:hypothetical protein
MMMGGGLLERLDAGFDAELTQLHRLAPNSFVLTTGVTDCCGIQ